MKRTLTVVVSGVGNGQAAPPRRLSPGKTLSCWHQYLDECPPDRGRNPRCFNGLPYRCEFPQVKIVCQQIRGHSVHNFAVAKSLTQSLSWAAWYSKRQRTPHHTPRGPRPSVTRRHRLALQTIENRVRPSERWSVYELTQRECRARGGPRVEKHSDGMPQICWHTIFICGNP